MHAIHRAQELGLGHDQAMETGDLTPAEQRLVHAAEQGDLLDLIPDVPDDQVTPESMGQWGNHQAIRSEVLRDLLQGRLAARLDPRGVRVRGAIIDGYVDLDGIACDVPLSLSSSYVPGGFTARAARLPALALDRTWIQSDGQFDIALDLSGTQVAGRLSMSGALLTSPAGTALLADGLNVSGGMLLNEGFRAEGAGSSGAVRLRHAHVDGALSMTGATLIGARGSALIAANLTVSGGLHMHQGFSAQGAGNRGVVNLTAAAIDGQLTLSGATLTSPNGPALSADRLTVSGGMFLTRGFTAEGAGDKGVIRLPGATIEGGLRFTGARLTSPDGPALLGDRLKVTGALLLDGGFVAHGASEKGTVRLLGAAVDGQLSLRGAQLTCTDGPALFADRLKVTGSLYLDDEFSADGDSGKGVVRLPAATIGERIRLDEKQVAAACNGHPWVLDALTYTVAPATSTDAWLNLLQNGTVTYSAQPYQQFAGIATEHGREQDARRSLMTQRRDQLRRGDLGRIEKTWTRFTGLTLGFGYQPWRALILLLATLVTSLLLVLLLGDDGLAEVDEAGSYRTACSTVEKVGYSHDLSIPLITVDAGDSCEPQPNRSGVAITVGGWILQLAGWASASLFVAGFTSVIRKV